VVFAPAERAIDNCLVWRIFVSKSLKSIDRSGFSSGLLCVLNLYRNTIIFYYRNMNLVTGTVAGAVSFLGIFVSKFRYCVFAVRAFCGNARPTLCSRRNMQPWRHLIQHIISSLE
jgi:hypothetical protein